MICILLWDAFFRCLYTKKMKSKKETKLNVKFFYIRIVELFIYIAWPFGLKFSRIGFESMKVLKICV